MSHIFNPTDVSGYQPLDSDLSAIAALGFTSTSFLKKTALNTWALDTSVYLTAETDPVFTAWLGTVTPANWNTAYGWGNHASAGYVTGTPWTGMGYYIGDGSAFATAAQGALADTALQSVTAHDLLSTTHGDTTAAAVVRGDIIIGSGATPKWTALAVGASGTYLAGGTEPSWATLNQAAVSGLTTASSPTFVGLTLTGLTTKRLLYSVDDVITDSANLTFDGTTLTSAGWNAGTGAFAGETKTLPSETPSNFYTGFVNNDATNYPAAYGSIFGYTNSANGYGYSYQIFHESGGSTGLSFREATSGAWTAWNKILTNYSATWTGAVDGTLAHSQVYFRSSNASGANVGPVIALGGETGNATTPYNFAVIKGAKESATAGSYAGYLAFYTTASNSAVSEAIRIDSSQRVGIGTTPTAVLHLKAGTATASTAPLKFTAGTDTTVAVEGQLEYSTGLLKLRADNFGLIADNGKMYFGAASDASIYYDGTNLIINPKDVGTGILDILGTLQVDGYNSSDGTAGASATTGGLTFKDGLYTSGSATGGAVPSFLFYQVFS